MYKFINIILILFVLTIFGCKYSHSEMIEQSIGIHIDKDSYEVIDFHEEWCPNGDGEYYLKIHIVRNNAEVLKAILSKSPKPLPVDDSVPCRFIDSASSELRKGYYLYMQDEKDSRDYALFIYDINSNNAYLCIEYY
ncbi:MAG: hypothetical protein MR294_04795 [Bacteroidales bacterium]|nr:hypothetical protein [Bacteroidales bacterium]